MFGYTNFAGANPPDDVSDFFVIPLSATQNEATIRNGTNLIASRNVVNATNDTTTGIIAAGVLIPGATTVDNAIDINNNIDNAEFAYHADAASNNIPIANNPTPTAAPSAGVITYIKTSAAPVFLSRDSLSYTGIRSYSHTFFSSMSYEWHRDTCTTYISLGKTIEFGTNDECSSTKKDKKSSKNNLCGPCVTCSVSQWSIWIKGGVAF